MEMFRKATLKDFEPLCLLRKELLTDPEDRRADEYAPYQEDNDRKWIKKCLMSRKKKIYIAEKEGRVLAHAIVVIETISPRYQAYYTYHKKALLVHLYVAPDKRGQGIGSNLLVYTLKKMQEAGVEFIDLDCYKGNVSAEKLYQKVGFKDVYTTKRFKYKVDTVSLK